MLEDQVPVAEAATLDLLDVGGRVLARRTVAGAGRHDVDFTAEVVGPGVYFVHARHSGAAVTRKVVFAR